MESMSAGLRAHTIFKFIIGINNFDLPEVRFLTQVYALAGADIIDVAARPDVVTTAVAAIAQVRSASCPGPASAHVMASLALAHDPHAVKAEPHPEHRALVAPGEASGIAATVQACLAAGAVMVEIHGSNSEDAPLRQAVEAASAVLAGRYLSVCLGADGWRSPRDVIRQAELVQTIHGPRTMIQAEGVTLATDGGLTSSLQGLALAQVLLAKTSVYVVVAGGANDWTRDLTGMLGIPIHGIASGSYARSLVAGFRTGGDEGGNLAAAVAIARRFARYAKGAEPHAL